MIVARLDIREVVGLTPAYALGVVLNLRETRHRIISFARVAEEAVGNAVHNVPGCPHAVILSR